MFLKRTKYGGIWFSEALTEQGQHILCTSSFGITCLVRKMCTQVSKYMKTVVENLRNNLPHRYNVNNWLRSINMDVEGLITGRGSTVDSGEGVGKDPP